MNKGRLEAFSDGLFAIISTIVVLDLRVPSGRRSKRFGQRFRSF
jgi:uncharacterized membrane protein